MARIRKIDILTAACTDVGRMRKANEDSHYASADENLIIVCDGMGGQVAGGLASKIAVETIKDVYLDIEDKHFHGDFYELDEALTHSAQRLVTAVRMANRRLYKIAAKFPKLRGMGTTVVALTFDKYFATMVHVGDSRIFRLSGNQIIQLTEDHSWLNELIEDNEINEEQIETFQQKNVITRALGTGPSVKIDIHTEKYKEGDTYVMCTDGLHSSVTERDIRKMLLRNSQTLDAVTAEMVEKAKKRDGTDNITVAIARINQDSKPTKKAGIAVTIPEESDRIALKEDKFIQEHYSEPKFKTNTNAFMNTFIPNKVMMFGLAALTGLACFFLGLKLQTGSTTPERPLSARVSGNVNRTTELEMPKAGMAVNPLKQASAITRSKLGKNAVLAFVFFNSEADYEKAKLEQRGDVLDKVYPYDNSTNPGLSGDFSIFLIDAASNVIHKTSDIKLPNFETKN